MAKSKARTALDSWLADANELFVDQRSRSIPPSSHSGSWAADQYQSTQTVGDVAAGLEGLLGQLVAAPGRWIFVIKDARTPVHYVQFLAFEDGSLISEVTSNYHLEACLDGRHVWTKAEEERLAAIGWEQPDPPWKPNWIDIRPVYSPPVDVVAARALLTLREVFGLSGDDAVIVKLFDSPNRGKTPASEVVVSPEPVGATKTRAGQE